MADAPTRRRVIALLAALAVGGCVRGGFSFSEGANDRGGPRAERTGPADGPRAEVMPADATPAERRDAAPSGVVTTMGGVGVEGYQDGPAATSKFNDPITVAVDSAGRVYVADMNSAR